MDGDKENAAARIQRRKKKRVKSTRVPQHTHHSKVRPTVEYDNQFGMDYFVYYFIDLQFSAKMNQGSTARRKCSWAEVIIIIIIIGIPQVRSSIPSLDRNVS